MSPSRILAAPLVAAALLSAAAPVAAAPGDALVLLRDDPGARARRRTPGAMARHLRGQLDARLAQLADEVPGLDVALAEDAVRRLWIAGALRVRGRADLVAALGRSDQVLKVSVDGEVPAPRTRDGDAPVFAEGAMTYGLARLGVPEVRRRYGLTGRGVRLGVLDTGADGDHPELAGKVVAYRDFMGGPPWPVDGHGHGTHVAGTVGGGHATDSDLGVAPGAQLVIARAVGRGKAEILEAMQWMLDPDGDPSTADAPRVVNCSWHTGGSDREPFYRALEAWQAAGIVASFSAGNMGPDGGVTRPKEHPSTFVSAATDHRDEVAKFSSKGPAKYEGVEQPKPDWAAPGAGVFSLAPLGAYATKSGTSMAAPHTTGGLGLLLEARPDLEAEELRAALIQTTLDRGPEGWDGRYGHGRLDLAAAVAAVARGAEVTVRVRGPGGQALVGSWLRASTRARTFTEGATPGELVAFLPVGAQTLEVGAFGYRAVEVDVEVAHGVAIELALDLEPDTLHAVRLEVGAQVAWPAEGVALTLVGVPGASRVLTQPGAVDLRLPAGRYPARFTGEGLAEHEVLVEVPGPALAVDLPPRPRVLLVDDDEGQRYDRYYQAALDDLGFTHARLDRVRVEATTEALDGYELVIWICGDGSRGILTASDRQVIQDHLEAGRKLLIFSQNLATELKGTDYLHRTLRAWASGFRVRMRGVEGLGFDVRIDGGDGASNQTSPDEVTAMYGSKVVLRYYNSQRTKAAGVVYKGQHGLVGFGLEGVATAGGRSKLLSGLLGELGLR